jgi:predicted ATP-dependent protease
VGGANEKVEGFFDACALHDLTGQQGVVIPAQNGRDLMLRREVVEAVAAGRFHVWPVSTVDEALEVLTGVPAGRRGRSGAWTRGSVNAAVEGRLRALAETTRSFAHGDPAV